MIMSQWLFKDENQGNIYCFMACRPMQGPYFYGSFVNIILIINISTILTCYIPCAHVFRHGFYYPQPIHNADQYNYHVLSYTTTNASFFIYAIDVR